MKPKLLCAALLATSILAPLSHAASPYTIEQFVRKQKFDDIKISPTGEYLAASVPVGRKTALAIVRRADNKLVASMSIPGDRTHVAGFWWVNDERVLISGAEKFGDLEAPQLTGELFGVNVDGSKGGMLVGQRLEGDGPGTRTSTKKVEQIAAFLVDDLPGDDKNVIISVRPFSNDAYTRVEKMDVYTGRRTPISQAPVRNAEFITDHAGNVRFAQGKTMENVSKLYSRDADGGEWKLVSDGKGHAETPIGFAADNNTAYLEVEQAAGPDRIVAMDMTTGARRDIVADDDTSSDQILYSHNLPIGVRLMDGLPRSEFFDPQSKEAKLYRQLEKAFPGQKVTITSASKDDRYALLVASSDQNPGDFFLYDATAKRVDRLLSRAEWIAPDKMATMKPVSFKARDGLDIHGYLTTPMGGEAKNLPMLIYIHGGPFGVYDAWGFDRDVQMLAAHGYAVLQVNYRGSGNHGLAFQSAGKREWGGRMQDDITDATRWAIQSGVADPARVCLYGASYGGYASLMGVAKEPTLYKCAAGYVGVYDLPTMHTHGDIQQRVSGENYVNDWIGPKTDIANVSPNRLADRIKVPVFLAAGGEDERAPIEHTQMMEKALRAAGASVEAHYYPTEGHGFYKLENELDYYTKLLTFFSRQLGGAMPVTGTPPVEAKK